MSEVQVSQGRAPSTGSREGPSWLFQLQGLRASLGWWPRPSYLSIFCRYDSPTVQTGLIPSSSLSKFTNPLRLTGLSRVIQRWATVTPGKSKEAAGRENAT